MNGIFKVCTEVQNPPSLGKQVIFLIYLFNQNSYFNHRIPKYAKSSFEKWVNISAEMCAIEEIPLFTSAHHTLQAIFYAYQCIYQQTPLPHARVFLPKEGQGGC